MNKKIILILILIAALFLRIFDITKLPLYGDELTIVLDSYSLSKLGTDQLGNKFPLTFQMGAGRPAGYVYFSIPFVILFGPNALGVRILSILSGLGIVFLLYIFGKRLFSEKVGIICAALACFNPWAISLSRAGFEANFALFLALLGTYLFIDAPKKSWLYILSGICFGLTLHTYPTYKVTSIFFLPILFWFLFKKEYFQKRILHITLAFSIFILLALLAASQTFIGGSETRLSNINVLSQEDLKNKIEQKINLERSITDLPQYYAKYFHNRLVEYSKIVSENYLQNFSIDFLVLHGDRNPRHNMATMGQLYLIEAILIILGLISLKDKRKLTFLILWILSAPIATSFVDLPHSLRSSFMLPPLIILAALGLITLLESKNKILISAALIIFLIQLAFFLQKLYFLAPNEYGNFWSYSAKIASDLAIKNKDQFKYVILSDNINDIEYAYPVYGKLKPEEVIDENKARQNLNNSFFKKFDNVYIGYIPDNDVEKFMKVLNGSVLFLGNAKNSYGFSNYEIINGTDNLPAIFITKR